MSHPLLRKELRSLAPFVGLVLFFDLLNWGDIFLTEFPDQFALAELVKQDGGEQAMMFVVAFALATSLLVREGDEGTLAFLDALPLSRARIFITKTALALGVLWLLPLSDLILKTVLYYWSRTSLEPQIRWPPLLTGTVLDAASCFVYLSLGLVLSFLRRFSLLLLGVLFCAYMLLQERQVPLVPWFNIFSLSDPVFQGRHWLVPTAKLIVQLGLGVVCLGLAFGAFQMMGDAAQRFAERAKRRWGIVLLGGLGTGLAIVIWVGLLLYWSQREGADRNLKVRYEEWPTGRARTARYAFLYPENQAGLVAKLLDHADAVEGRVRQFLHAQPIQSIQADLTGADPHNAGLAHWKQVQIDLGASGSGIDELMAVLAHETTHVLIEHESEGRISDDFNATRFFHEGLASYVEYHLFRPAERLSRLRRVAATMHARQEVKFEELIDSGALARKRDTDLVYPLGEVFVEALVNRYGEAMVGQVVRAFSRPGAPTDLKGAELWRDVLQSCGGNLSEVEDSLIAELDKSVAEHNRFVNSLPRLRGAVQQEAGYIVVRAKHDRQGRGTILCRFRPRADTPERLYEYAFAEEPGVFRVANAGYPERSFWYQLGWRAPGASQPIYEPWVEIALK